MTIIPLQYFGLGDIIYTVKLIRELAGSAPILWPAQVEFVEGLTRAYPDIRFRDRKLVNVDYQCKEDKIVGDTRLVPIRWADTIRKVPYTECMRAKYDLYNKDYRTWKDSAEPVWDEQRGQQLFTELELKPGESYNLINNTFRSDFEGNAQIKLDNGFRNIEMKVLPGYSLFDWHQVLRNAAEIHTVSTSLLFILELLPLTQPIHLYPRPEDPQYCNVNYLFTKPYVLHYKDGSIRHSQP